MSSRLTRKIAYILIGFLLTYGPVRAEDTEIYFGGGSASSTTTVRPNVLFIFDTSISMSTLVPGTSKSRLQTMKEAMIGNGADITGVVNDLEDVNLGIMRFTNRRGGW